MARAEQTLALCQARTRSSVVGNLDSCADAAAKCSERRAAIDLTIGSAKKAHAEATAWIAKLGKRDIREVKQLVNRHPPSWVQTAARVLFAVLKPELADTVLAPQQSPADVGGAGVGGGSGSNTRASYRSVWRAHAGSPLLVQGQGGQAHPSTSAAHTGDLPTIDWTLARASIAGEDLLKTIAGFRVESLVLRPSTLEKLRRVVPHDDAQEGGTTGATGNPLEVAAVVRASKPCSWLYNWACEHVRLAGPHCWRRTHTSHYWRRTNTPHCWRRTHGWSAR